MLATEHPDTFRSKAETLRHLQSAGFCVPEFMVLTFEALPDCSDDSAQTGHASAEHSQPALDDIVRQLGFPLAVRSSAAVEDGPTASFAGQFRSFLNLATTADVRAAVDECRESMSATAVTEYCRRHGITSRSPQMQVIVQRMVQPELAGVAFTVNPVTGSEEVVVEACAGPADELLSGRTSALPDDHPLLQKYRAAVIAVAGRVARHFGCPQDIEFAVENGIVCILQSRPITIIGTTGISGEWTNANFREGGVSSTACSPLMWSLYDQIFDTSLKSSLREIRLLSDDFEAARMFFGRPYWNLGALKQCLTRIPGFVEREFDTDLGVEIRYDDDGVRTSVTPWRLIRVLPAVLAIRRYLRKQMSAATRFLDGGFEDIERRYVSLPDDIDGGFRRLIEQDYYRFECTYFRTIFSLSLAKLDFKLFFPQADFSALMSALPEVSHSAPLRRMQQMVADGETDVTSLLQEFRHHYHVGLDVCQPRWDEDPDYVQQLLQQLPARCAENAGIDYEQVRAETAARLPYRKRHTFHRKLDRLRHLVWLREQMRDLSNRMYYLIRQYAREIARRRNLGDDIFLMTCPEIFADDRSGIERRRETYESYRSFRPPNELGLRFSGRTAASHGDLRGLAASPGTVRGTARIAHTIKEALQLPQGSILVSPFTDPGWTAALSRVVGVATEAGGMLSHAAVICREFGIPAVLAIPEACRRIADGSTIVIHGNEGFVEVLQAGE